MMDKAKMVRVYVCQLCKADIQEGFCSPGCPNDDWNPTERDINTVAERIERHVPYDCPQCEALRKDLI